jgi:arylsulfatase A-like enzyme
MYWARATHAPHHVPKEWSDKYKGKLDGGRDTLREQIMARQKELGVVPADAELTRRHDEIPASDDMPADLKQVLAREMELYTGFLEQTDHEVGRLVDTLGDPGVLEDTLIYYIIGDNGASAEGTLNGFSGQIDWVQIDIGDDGQDHLIKAEDPATDRNGTAIMLQLLVIQSRVDPGVDSVAWDAVPHAARPAFQQILAISGIGTKLHVVSF